MSQLIKIADWGGEKRGNVVFVHGLDGHPYDTWRRHPDDGTERLGFIVWGTDSARDFVANKPELRDLNFSYRELAKMRGNNLRHLVYYEMVDTPFGRIVNPHSADPAFPDCKPTPVREDHITIAKPRRRDELVYAKTKSFISKLAPEPSAVGELRGYPLEPFKIEYQGLWLIPPFP